MNLEQWINLPENEQSKMCQSLIVYDEWDLFKSIEEEFRKEFGSQEGVGKVFCGLADQLGPMNAITVYIRPKKKRTKLPKHYLGFPVIRVYGKVT